MRKAQVTWEEWEQLWSAEKSWERERRHEMGLDEMWWKKLRRHQMSWDKLRWWAKMGWHRMRWQWDAVSNFQKKLRCDDIRWNERRLNIPKTCVSQSLDIWKIECLQVCISESLNVWKSECLEGWMSESLNVLKSDCLKDCMSWDHECQNVWMSQSLHVTYRHSFCSVL